MIDTSFLVTKTFKTILSLFTGCPKIVNRTHFRFFLDKMSKKSHVHVLTNHAMLNLHFVKPKAFN